LRDADIDISRATMCGWVTAIGEMLMSVSAAMRSQLLAGTYIQADETPVDVQTHDGSGTNHQAYLWQYGTPGGMTVFDFRMSRKREGPLNFLENFEGLLQTDGYAAYDRVGGPKMGCSITGTPPKTRCGNFRPSWRKAFTTASAEPVLRKVLNR
jgi:hypothetical protein